MLKPLSRGLCAVVRASVNARAASVGVGDELRHKAVMRALLLIQSDVVMQEAIDTANHEMLQAFRAGA